MPFSSFIFSFFSLQKGHFVTFPPLHPPPHLGALFSKASLNGAMSDEGKELPLQHPQTKAALSGINC